jgi:hypothetical protein
MATPKIPTPKTPSTRVKQTEKITKKPISKIHPVITKTITKRVQLPTPPSRAALLQKNRKTRPVQGI